MLFFIGTTELIIIFLAILLLFGSKKIPEVARSLGKGIREFQKASEEIKKQIADVDSQDSEVASSKNDSEN